MGRNRLIYALSQVTLVVASDEGQGGTWEGAVEALRGQLTDVAVWQGPGAGPGNTALVALGGRAVSSIPDLWAIRKPVAVRHPDEGQMSLGL
jgi:predicted Rossmann fold nucleotide-binding protein DprA/Smf involved in DNA uptake